MGVPDPEEDEDETAELLAPFAREFPDLLGPRTEPSIKATSRQL